MSPTTSASEAVCRPWRLCSTDPRQQGILDPRFHPRQWIMLREEAGGAPYRRRFMNISTGYCRYVPLPELRGHKVFPTTEGLLVLLDTTTFVVRLLNPLTRHAADLPPATMLMTKEQLLRTYTKESLKVSGAGLADDSTVAVYFRGIRTLAIIKPGDANWIVVDRGTWLMPALSFAGRFYCASTSAVMVVETHPPRLAVAVELARPFAEIMMDSVHLFDNEGELMLLDRQRNACESRNYKVYRVDLDVRKMVPVRGLGGRAVFIDMEMALSVSPSVFPSISADAIYWGFHSLLTVDSSPIHLRDATVVEPCKVDNSRGRMPLCGPRGVDDYLSWFVTIYRGKN
ncbi:hypothetical protein ACP70R_020058 [Stipagrostis hirtigluma subsp. patula]